MRQIDYKNAAIVTKVVDGANVVQAIFVETSNECNILGTTPPSGNTTAGGEGELTLNDTLPATDATITPTASNVPTLDGDSIDTVNGGLFNGFDASALSGKKFTTLTVTIPVEGKFAIRQTNAALAGSATDGRVNGNIKIAGYENAGSETEIELSVVVMEGGGDIIQIGRAHV